jgi:ubiquinone biosynthesis protein
VLLRLFETARRFQMEVQPQLVLLQKTLLQIEGLGRQLYPQLDLWKTAQPILREWAAERISGRSFAQELRRHLPDLSEAIRALPQTLQSLAQHASDGRILVRVEQPGMEELREELRLTSRRRDGTLIGATLLLGGIVWTAVGASLLPGLALAAAGGVTILVARRLR